MKPDWSKAPEWANYWAMDESGTVYWFEDEPMKSVRHGSGIWVSSTYLGKAQIHKPEGIDWENSVQQRPETAHHKGEGLNT